MSNNNNRAETPLSMGFVHDIPRICAILGTALGTDPNLLLHVSAGVNTWGGFIELMQVPAQAADRNYGLILRADRTLDDNGQVATTVITLYSESDLPVMTLHLGVRTTCIQVQGFLIDYYDETATRFNGEGLYQVLTNNGGYANLFNEALRAMDVPRAERAAEVYKAAKTMIAQVAQHRLDDRGRLGAKIARMEAFIEAVQGCYDASDGRTVMERGAMTTQDGRIVSGVTSITYSGDGYVLELTPDSTILLFDFGTIVVGDGNGDFDAGNMIKTIAEAGPASGYLPAVLKAVEAFETFSVDDPEGESMRRRILRVVLGYAGAPDNPENAEAA